MTITITGASGFIGRRLMKQLAGHDLRVLSRHAGMNLPAGVRLSVWNPVKGPPPPESLEGADAVIHLAGEPVAQRWTPEVKRKIRESRVLGTRNLVAGFEAASPRPPVLVSGSAVGYYGSRGDQVLTEDAPPGEGFLAGVCREWEQAAFAAKALGVRVVAVRTGVVLAPHGGALARMLPPFRAMAGGRLGSGNQWMPWIHLDDMAALLAFAAEQPVRGPINASAPNPVTNKEFTAELGRALHRPALFPVPEFGLRLLFGEMAGVLLSSQRAIPRAAREAGFTFHYPDLAGTLKHLLNS